MQIVAGPVGTGVLYMARACSRLPEASTGGLESDTGVSVLLKLERVLRPGLPEAGTAVLDMARSCPFFLGLQRSKSSIY
ncbi:hypothetical protein JCGZ_09639 [Jatropha curcas]|uniref:Uncharacterized protein n=1 Tax=Jatropha curcas TaxID=180498 RepID=A0A067LKZ4_JATCU|nr:hypothetical protein JCGZ_09639 [Jatropha curcas]